MPQTEEEHLENQNLDYEDQEKLHPDAEVCKRQLLNILNFDIRSVEAWQTILAIWQTFEAIR